MWYLIFAGMFAAMVAGVIYLISRVYKLDMVAQAAGGNRHVRRLLAALPVAAVFMICYFLIGMINTAIVVVHTLCVWLILEAVGMLLGRIGKKKFNYNVFFCVGVLILVFYFGIAWYLAHHVTATRYEIDTEKPVRSLRVVQISDSHVGATFDGEGFAGEMEKVQAEDPDVVVITGDFVDDDTTKEDMLRSCEALGELKTTYGVYFVFGNHDKGYYSDESRGYGGAELVENLEANGVKVLEDETVSIADDYYLIGRKDRSEEYYDSGRMVMEDLIADLDPEKYMIVLDHQPNDFDAQEASGVDLVLSGHTHGGQFIPINYLGEWSGQNDMTYGIRKRGNTIFEVSSGISDWAIKFKTGCKAEYVVLDIAK